MPLREDWEITASLDIGSTFSGYAFSHKGDEQTMYSYTEWGADVGVHHSHKTPTCVLLDHSDRFVAMGFEAVMKYSDLLPEDVDSYKFVNNLEMSDAKVYRENKNIIVMIMRYLKKHMQDQMEKHSRRVVPDEKTRWVIPVPEKWSHEDKSYVRKAAAEAQLVSDPDKLVIASQAEVALVFCEGLKQDGLAVNTGAPAGNKKNSLVLDCGGGNLKMTACRDSVVHHVYQPYQVGAAQLDREFLHLLDKIFGKFMEEFKKRCPGDYQSLLTMFEGAKRYIKPDQDSNTTIQIMYQLGATYADIHGRGMDESIKPEYQGKVRIWRGKIFIPNDLTKELFETVMKPFVGALEAELARPGSDINQVVLVGGFGDSPLVQRRMEEVVNRHKCSLLIPKDCSGAVLKGAVWYGQRYTPRRQLKRSYGLKVRKPYIKDKHPKGLHSTVDGREYVRDAFDKFVSRGHEVITGQNESKNYYPVAERQTKIILVFFSSEKKDPEYIEECTEETTIDMTLKGTGRERKIAITMTFREEKIDINVKGPNGEERTQEMTFH